MFNIYVGTSGWSYQHWRGVFYPQGLSQKDWFDYYCQFFNSVELNVTFYRILKRDIFKHWFIRSPKDFCFSLKGNRLITHIKRLNDKKNLNALLKDYLELKNKLAVILWQLPSNFKKDLKRLEDFLKNLKKFDLRNVFEFRDKSWFCPETYDLMKDYNSALCIADSSFWPHEKQSTADFIYLRFHGRDGLYSGDYTDNELKEWADFSLAAQKDIFAFFNNDAFGFAIKNALKFKEFLLKK